MALAGALLLAMASPPGLFAGSWIFLPLGLALLFEASRVTRGPHGLLSSYIAGALFLFWVSWSLRYLFFWLPLLLAPGIGGLYWVLMAWVWRRSEARLGLRWQPWLFAVSWTTVEWIRAEMPQVGYPQSFAVLGFYEQPWLLGPVAILGTVGQTFLLALLGAGLWALLFTRGRLLIRTLPVVVSLILWFGLSFWPSATKPVGKPLRVALMQPATPTYPDEPEYSEYHNMVPEERLRFFRPLVQSFPRVDLVVWPESFAPSIPETDLERSCEAISTYLGGGQATLFGASLYEQIGEKSILRRNAAFLVSDKGRYLGRHEKRRLVPLGEALPLVEQILPRSGLLGLHDWIRETSGGWPMLVGGRPQDLMSLQGHRFGTPICYENAFPSLFRADTRRGAEFFVVLSFENWYRQGSELDQLLALSVFGALEVGRPILRCTDDGISAHVDTQGRITQLGTPRRREAIHAEIQPVTGDNPALFVGAWLPWLLLLLSLFPFFSRFLRKSEA
jgi:apolipoprotein N-acyltransferase